jgi:hypothetical protein
MIDPVPALLIVLSIAVLLAVSASHKLKDLPLFSTTVVAYRVIPERAARRLAWSVPGIELGLAAALLWPPSRAWGLLGAMGLFAAYAAAMARNLARNRRDLDCGCAGPGHRRPIAAWMVWRNLALATASGFAALPWMARPFSGADLLTIAAGFAAVSTLYASVDRLLGDVAPRALALRGDAT